MQFSACLITIQNLDCLCLKLYLSILLNLSLNNNIYRMRPYHLLTPKGWYFTFCRSSSHSFQSTLNPQLCCVFPFENVCRDRGGGRSRGHTSEGGLLPQAALHHDNGRSFQVTNQYHGHKTPRKQRLRLLSNVETVTFQT